MDIPAAHRFGFMVVAIVLHVLVALLVLVNLEGQANDAHTQAEAEDILFFVETVIVDEANEVEEAAEPDIQEEVVEEEIVEEAEVIEQAEVPAPKMIQPRISPVKIVAKPSPPSPLKVKLKPALRSITQTKQVAKAKPGLIKPTYPAYLKNPTPPYPKMARKRGLEGVVHLWVQISTKGHVQSIKIHQSSGHRMLDDQALQTVKNWRFLPAKRQGVACVGEVIVPIRFQLR